MKYLKKKIEIAIVVVFIVTWNGELWLILFLQVTLDFYYFGIVFSSWRDAQFCTVIPLILGVATNSAKKAILVL